MLVECRVHAAIPTLTEGAPSLSSARYPAGAPLLDLRIEPAHKQAERRPFREQHPRFGQRTIKGYLLPLSKSGTARATLVPAAIGHRHPRAQLCGAGLTGLHERDCFDFDAAQLSDPDRFRQQ